MTDLRPLLPLSLQDPSSPRRSYLSLVVSQVRRRPYRLVILLCLFLFILLNLHTLGTFRRDLIYLIRPIWDTPERAFTIIDHFPLPPGPDLPKPQLISKWCQLHGWDTRPDGPPRIVDAILFSTELDMLEIRMREYAKHVSTFIVVEANATFAGDPKPLHFAEHRERFNEIAAEAGGKVVYRSVLDLKKGQPRGSFVNEETMRRVVGDVLSELQLPKGSLVIQTDVDEIISRDTLNLLSSCHGFPPELHLNVKNYRYGFNFPIPDQGYWRPRIHTITAQETNVPYYHGRGGDTLLADAGWHCTFCFRTLVEMVAKMRGYSHNDRLRSEDLVDLKNLRHRVCVGKDPFNMFPEAWTFKDIIAQSGSIRHEHSFRNLPIALAQDPLRFSYLLSGGCERPDE
ncbi:glycosyl transferase [Naematelia encephala]|uniref:Glycosyl transferase n=1 Tax=Naematelia encephala TaxID=71784 RepID=A0A1Y2BHM3_9TREE|nr:glycosyl transferase [Naematelia encephala]